MPIRVDLLPLEPNLPGQARLSIKKWQGGRAHLRFSIQRNQDQFFLHGGQQWSSTEFWFEVSSLSPSADGSGLETPVGAELVDPVLEGSGSSKFQIVLHDTVDGLKDRGVVQPGAGLLPSTAGGETRSSFGSAALSTPPPVVVPEPAVKIPELPELTLPTPEPIAEPVIEPVVAAPTPPARKNTWLLPLIILLIVLAAAAAAWWWFNHKAETPAAPAPAPVAAASVAAASPSAGACTAESMASDTELGFVQNCLKQAPDSAALLQIIQQAKANKHCGVAQRLYANRSQAGDVLIATAYAHEYDPKFHQANDCFAEPDAATAAYWYETILGVQPDNAEAKQRFQELKP